MNEFQPLLPVVAIFSLAVATLISEDLTCVAAGVLVGGWTGAVRRGGRRVPARYRRGRPRAHARRPHSWPDRIRHAVRAPPRLARDNRAQLPLDEGTWRDRHVVEPFRPGHAAGHVPRRRRARRRLQTFALYVSLSALVWVPALVGLSAVAGAEVVEAGLLTASGWAGRGIVVCASLVLALKAAAWLARWKNRRRLYGLWQRWTRWEFWPLWVFYPPGSLVTSSVRLTPRACGLSLRAPGYAARTSTPTTPLSPGRWTSSGRFRSLPRPAPPTPPQARARPNRAQPTPPTTHTTPPRPSRKCCASSVSLATEPAT